VPFWATHSGEPRRSAPMHVACLATCRLPLRVRSRFESTPTLASSLPRRCHERGHRVSPERCIHRQSPPLFRGTPGWFRVFQAHSQPTCHNFMTSDVGRGLRDEGPVRAHSSREWSSAGAPPRGRPRAPSVIAPGASAAGVAAYVLAIEPGTTKTHGRAFPREGESVPESQDAWNRSVSRIR